MLNRPSTGPVTPHVVNISLGRYTGSCAPQFRDRKSHGTSQEQSGSRGLHQLEWRQTFKTPRYQLRPREQSTDCVATNFVDWYVDGDLVVHHTQAVPSASAPFLFSAWGTNKSTWGGTATVGPTRYMYISNFKYTP